MLFKYEKLSLDELYHNMILTNSKLGAAFPS